MPSGRVWTCGLRQNALAFRFACRVRNAIRSALQWLHRCIVDTRPEQLPRPSENRFLGLFEPHQKDDLIHVAGRLETGQALNARVESVAWRPRASG